MSERSLYKTIFRLGVSVALILGPHFARASAQSVEAQAVDQSNGHILFTSPESFIFYGHLSDPECETRQEGCYVIGDSTRFDLDPESFDFVTFTTLNGSPALFQDNSLTWDYRSPANVWHPSDINHTFDSQKNQLDWSWRPFLDDDPANNPNLLILDINLPPGVTSTCPTRNEVFYPDNTVRNCTFTSPSQDSTGTIEWREITYPGLQMIESGRINFELSGSNPPTPEPTITPIITATPTPTANPELTIDLFVPFVQR